LPARLILSGGFTVTDSQQRHLQQQAVHLGFADLRACLQALLDDGWSIPQLATHLTTTQAVVRRAITDHHVPQPSRRQQLARQRQRAARQRACDRIAKLGFDSMRAYLVERLVTKAWTLRQVEAELGAAPATLRRLLDHHQVRRVALTRRQRAAATAVIGPATQARAVQQRRQARLTELGFGGLEEYVQDWYLTRGWSLRRLCAELGVGYGWLDQQLTRLGLRP
jgi:lambda repressor-like predicted transcriptional regulator